MGLVPDFAFGLTLAESSRRHFMVEIDRGTMPVVRSDSFRQTSFEEKMRAYLTAHAAKQHERQFGWKTFRVLTVTTDHHRMQSMMEALRKLRVPHSPGAPLFFFTTRDELRAADPLTHDWRDGNDLAVLLYFSSGILFCAWPNCAALHLVYNCDSSCRRPYMHWALLGSSRVISRPRRTFVLVREHKPDVEPEIVLALGLMMFSHSQGHSRQ
jgi:hypothetical protein